MKLYFVGVSPDRGFTFYLKEYKIDHDGMLSLYNDAGERVGLFERGIWQYIYPVDAIATTNT